MNDRDAVSRRGLCQNYNFPPLPSLNSFSTCPSCSPPLFHPYPFCFLFLPFHPPPQKKSPTLLFIHLSLPSSIPSSPPLSTSCSAEISAETPVRLSGDRDGGCDITAPSADCQPSAVAMATSATACGAEAGEEAPAGEGGRGETGECVRNSFSLFFFFASPARFLDRRFAAVAS